MSKSGHRMALTWRHLRASYRYANLASHHALGFIVKTVVLVYFVLALVFLVLRYVILPHVDIYKHNIEQIASGAIGRPVTIDRVYASWQGLRPNLFLGDVVIRDQQGRAALTLPSVSATLSWWSVLSASLRFETLEIGRPDLDIRRSKDGKLYIASLFIDNAKESDGTGLDWLLAQREIVIREGRLHWLDETRSNAELALDGVTFVMQNQWRRHRAALRATPPTVLAAPIDVRLDFVHPPFVGKISDIKRWKGVLFVDVQDTDLALWKNHVSYPLEVLQGIGSVRAWLSFDHAKLADFTADLKLVDAAVRLQAALPALELARVQGRVSARESFDAFLADGKPTFGAAGHTVQLSNFSLLTKDGLTLIADSIEEQFTPATRLAGEIMEIKASSLDLRTLAGLAERLPLSRQIRQGLVDFAPQGQLKDFSARWQGTVNQLESYQVKGEFINLAMKEQAARLDVGPGGNNGGKGSKPANIPDIPGFEHLSGKIDANEHGGQLQLNADGFKLALGGYFPDPEWEFGTLRMDGAWRILKDEKLLLDIRQMAFEFDGVKGELSGQHTLPFKSKRAGAAVPAALTDINATLSGFDISHIDRYLPLKTHPVLRHWLSGALMGGHANEVQLRIKGDMAHFPFRAEGGHDKKGEFRVSGKIKQGKLNYLPGVFGKDGQKPLWPLLEEVDGNFVFDRTRMEISADTAKTHGVDLNRVKAVIPDLASKDAVLDIDGNASGALNEMLHYVNDSQVGDWIGGILDEAHSNGNARLGLKFRLPLAHLIDTKVAGVLQFGGNDITLFSLLPELSQTNGKLEFSERGFALNGVTAQFAGGPLSVQGGSTREVGVQIRASGMASAEGIKHAWAYPGMQKLAENLQGSTRFAVAINVKKNQSEILVESSLQGLALQFPQPLKKAALESLPLRVQILGAGVDEAGVQREKINLSLGSAATAATAATAAAGAVPLMRAQYWRQKNGKTPWRVLRGGIAVGNHENLPEPDSGLHLNLNMKAVNVDAWRALANRIARSGNGVAAPVPAGENAGEEGQAGQAGADAGEPNAIAQYVDPDVMSARAGELVVLGKKLDNVVVGVSVQKGVWQANIDSNQASGYLTWNLGASGLGKVTARLSQLFVPESSAADVTDLLEGSNEATTIPALDVVADNFELFNKKLGHLELVADNVRTGSGAREWRFSRLQLTNPDAELRASGKWLPREAGNSGNAGNGGNGGNAGNNTQLSYSLVINDAGKMLERFGFANVLKGGQGKVEGDLNWKGLPFVFDTPTLAGNVTMQIANGQFLKVEPGAAKLLGVLSLQALPRLLKLDFHDVFSEGFAFDAATAQLAISKGVISTDNLKMRGVNATVLMDGSADINKETQNLHVVVIPDINVGTASVVYALAVNPVIGLGSFLAQLFLKNPMMKALTFQYQVTGSWKDPLVNKLETRASQAPPATSATSAPPTAPAAPEASSRVN
jgi:uncharacterized protein (TIGR02099 family)